MDSKIIKEIKKILEFFLKSANFSDFEVDIKESKLEELMIFNIQIKEDSQILIGKKGKNLDALNLLVRSVVFKKIKEPSRFIIDVNNYKRERIKTLKELAKTAAQRVNLTKDSFELPPMSAFERRIIHLELSVHPNIKTESEGKGEDRHIVIKPI